MSHKHSSPLRAIFHDPVSGNTHWREIESLLHHPHQSNVCDKHMIKQLREFLSRAGVTPSSYENDA